MPAVSVTIASTKIRFRLRYDTEARDGAVLQKVGAGAYQNFTAAGGTFTTGGYTGPLNTAPNNDNPLAGQQAWHGSSGGWVNVLGNLPASTNGQTVQFRWAMGSDVNTSVAGVWVDNVEIIGGYTCGGGPTPTPTVT